MAAESAHPRAARGLAAPRGLPFGAVMATGAVSQLTDLAGMPALRVPLLVVAILIAGTVTYRSALRVLRGGGTRPSLTARFGQFTVPVGLAVIAVGLAEISGAPFGVAAAVVAGLAAASTIVITVTTMVSAGSERPGLTEITGVWFIAPAAYLADAVAGVAVHSRLAEPVADTTANGIGGLGSDVVLYAVLASVTIGAIGYAVAVAAGAARLFGPGLAGAPRVAWWIVAGCGGLAALALGKVARAVAGAAADMVVTAPDPGTGLAEVFSSVSAVLVAVSVVCAATATVVLVPIAVASIRFLIRTVAAGRPSIGRAPWPPAFSSGVYALGCAEVSQWLQWPALEVLSRVVAVETMIVWAAIVVVNTAAWLRTSPR